MRRCATLAKFNFTHFQRNIPGDVGGIHGFVGKALKALIYLYFHVEIFVFVFGNICISKYLYLCLEIFVFVQLGPLGSRSLTCLLNAARLKDLKMIST